MSPSAPPRPSSRDRPLPARPTLCSMRPLGLEGTPALRRRPLLRLLLLLSLLQWRVTRAQTTPGTPRALTTPGEPSSRTTPATSSTPSVRERARALMRDFPLVDGCVRAVWGQVETEPTPKLGKEFSACRASEKAPSYHLLDVLSPPTPRPPLLPLQRRHPPTPACGTVPPLKATPQESSHIVHVTWGGGLGQGRPKYVDMPCLTWRS